MRVLMIVEAGGGVARHVTDLCCGLHNDGVDVHLIYSPVRTDSVWLDGLQRLQDHSIPVTALSMQKNPGPSDLAVLWRLWKYAKQHGPFDVVHGHSSKGGALARLLFGVGSPAKIYSAHAFITMNPNLSGWFFFLYGRIERFLALLGDAVIATSTQELEHSKDCLKIPSEKIYLIPNGIEQDRTLNSEVRSRLRLTWNVGEDEILIGTVARFVEQKSLVTLVRAFAQVTKSTGRARLVLVGDGPQKKLLQEEADRLDISSRVIWPGYVDEPNVMSAFDVFALSSTYEGFPYVLLDALATGLPVVSTKIGGSDMVVADGLNGFLVGSGDHQVMAEALVSLCVDDSKRKRMGQCSLKKVKEFSLAMMIKKSSDLYQKLVYPSLSNNR